MMKISIIMCTYDRSEDLSKALNSLACLEVRDGWNYTVQVVDNSPDGRMKDVVSEVMAKWPAGKLIYQREPKRGKGHAMNAGIAAAAGDIIAFTDDDVIVDPQWLVETIRCFETTQCDGVGGRVLPDFPKGTPQWIIDNGVQLAGSVVIYDYGAETLLFKRGMYPFIGANIVFKKHVFAQCGLFRTDLGPGMPTMGEDTEFIERLSNKGKKLMYCGQALVKHPFDPSRMGLGHVARWHIALGRFDALREKGTGQSFVYVGGVPRYLFVGMLKDGLRMLSGIYSKISFYNAWRAFFRKVGMVQMYRESQKKEMPCL